MHNRRATVLLMVGFCITLTPAWAGEVIGYVKISSVPASRAQGPDYMFQGNSPRYASLRGNSSYGAGLSRNDGPSAQDLKAQDEIENVVIELLDSNNKLPLTPVKTEQPGRNVMVQKNKNFLPHVVVVPKGSTVFFPNEDHFFHHIYSISKDPKGFELPEHRGNVSKVFEQSGVLELFCGLHPRMNSYLYISQSNYATKPNSSHQYRLGDVPAGKYKVRVWHPRLPARTLEITVPAQGSVTLDLDL